MVQRTCSLFIDKYLFFLLNFFLLLVNFNSCFNVVNSLLYHRYNFLGFNHVFSDGILPNKLFRLKMTLMIESKYRNAYVYYYNPVFYFYKFNTLIIL